MPKVRDYLYEEKTHRGDTRYRFRWDRDAKRITIPGAPGEPAFERQYRQLVEVHRRGIDPTRKAERDEGSFAWLARRYFSEMDLLVDQGLMAPATRKQRVNLLMRCLPKWGDGRILTIRPEHCRAMMADFRQTPGQANNLLKTQRAMFRFAVEANLMDHDPTVGLKRFRMPQGGFKAWNRAQLRAFLAMHPVGTQAHLAMMLLIGTACRRSDLVLLGPQHIVEHDGVRLLSFVQAKHGFAEESRVTVPIIRPLEEALAASETGAATFLTSAQGQPYSKNGFGPRFRKWCDAADLPTSLSCHGVRKAVGALLADAGCTPHQIMAFHGHADARTSEVYTKSANRKLLATDAAARAAMDDFLDDDDDDGE